MQNDNNQINIQPTPELPQQITQFNEQPKTVQNNYPLLDYTLLIFGVLAILSMLLGNGIFLKFTLMLFFIFAMLLIIRGVISTYGDSKKVNIANNTYASPNMINEAPKKRHSVLKTILIVSAIIVAIPIVGYISLIVFLMIAFSAGGI